MHTPVSQLAPRARGFTNPGLTGSQYHYIKVVEDLDEDWLDASFRLDEIRLSRPKDGLAAVEGESK